MKKTAIRLCIIIPVIALLLGVTSFVLNLNKEHTETTLGPTGGDCDNTQVKTTHGCNDETNIVETTQQTSADEESEIKTVADLLSSVTFDGISNYTVSKSAEYERIFFDDADTAAFILESLYAFDESRLTDVKPLNEYGYHFTLFSGDEKYELSVLDKYVRFSSAEKTWCFFTGADFYTFFSTTYLRHFQCVAPADENAPERIIRFNPETVHLESSQDIREATVGFCYSEYDLGDEILLKKNGKIQKRYEVNDSVRQIVQLCLNITEEGYDDAEKGKSEISFTLFNFGQSYNVSFNSNGYTYISQGDFEKKFETVGAYYLFKMEMLKNKVADNNDTTPPTEIETEHFLPPGFEMKKILTESATLGDFFRNAMYYQPQCSQWVTYEQKGKQTVIYSIGVNAHNLIDELINSNYDKKAEIRQSATDEALVFESSFNGETGIISTYLCSDGYLYITFDGVTRGFNIGTDAYNRFMKDFELCTVVWTKEEPATIG